MRVRWKIKQKAHVRAKCVRAKVSKCEVRACDGKIVALQHSGKKQVYHIALSDKKSETQKIDVKRKEV